jgi:hypothetical protein
MIPTPITSCWFFYVREEIYMQFYIATASDADSADMEWESLQDLEVSEDFDQTSQELLYSINNNLTQINTYVGFTVTVGFALIIVYIIIKPVFYKQFNRFNSCWVDDHGNHGWYWTDSPYYLQVSVMAVRDFRLSEVPLLLHWCMEVFMSVRLALAVLVSAIFCFPCYASSALPASPSNALIKGYDIPDLPKSDSYASYAIIKNTVSYSMNKDYADYIFYLRSSLLLSSCMVGMVFKIIHFTFQGIWVGIMTLLCTLFHWENG